MEFCGERERRSGDVTAALAQVRVRSPVGQAQVEIIAFASRFAPVDWCLAEDAI